MCVLDLGDSIQVVALCASSHNGDRLCQVLSKAFQEFINYAGDTKCGLLTFDFKRDHDLGGSMAVVALCTSSYNDDRLCQAT